MGQEEEVGRGRRTLSGVRRAKTHTTTAIIKPTAKAAAADIALVSANEESAAAAPLLPLSLPLSLPLLSSSVPLVPLVPLVPFMCPSNLRLWSFSSNRRLEARSQGTPPSSQ